MRIGDRVYQQHELTFNSALLVAGVDKRLNEKRLTTFLKGMLCDDKLPLRITAQERYYLLIKYIEKQGKALLALDIDVSKCYLEPSEWKNSISSEGVVVRQLTGRDVELMEANCKNPAEWIACMMACQLSYEGHEHLSELPEQNADDAIYKQQFMSRLACIKNLAVSDFEKSYSDFAQLNDQLFSLVHLTIGAGGLLVSRGADAAPVRFRASTAFIGLIKELDEFFA